MDFLINSEELAALCGLSHVQQLAYLRGIRPYMDVQTGLVGVKRKISHQSIAEQLYVEPHQGIASICYSRTQIRRALAGLERAGVIALQSQGLQLILKCNLASFGYFVQNKADINPTQQADIAKSRKILGNKGHTTTNPEKAGIANTHKADTPLKDNNYYIFLSKQFEIFWSLYPVKKSQGKAWEIFQDLNPSESQCTEILNALQKKISFSKQQQARGLWVPNWKNPTNWLIQECWKDELTETAVPQEKAHGTNKSSHSQTTDSFWELCQPEAEDDSKASANVIAFPQCRG